MSVEIPANDDPYGVFSIPLVSAQHTVHEREMMVNISIFRRGGTFEEVTIILRTIDQNTTSKLTARAYLCSITMAVSNCTCHFNDSTPSDFQSNLILVHVFGRVMRARLLILLHEM